MSVDLIGCTAFKRTYKNWFQLLQDNFFSRATSDLVEAFQSEKKGVSDDIQRRGILKVPKYGEQDVGDVPRMWKTMGDEIVFVYDVASNTTGVLDSICLIRGFIQYLEKINSNEMLPLTAKGACWLALIPQKGDTENSNVEITIPSASKDNGGGVQWGSQTYVEYIGPSMDAGFRVAHNYSSRYELALSVELAWLLAYGLNHIGHEEDIKFIYEQGEILKGLLEENARYPKIALSHRYVRTIAKDRQTHDTLVRRTFRSSTIMNACCEMITFDEGRFFKVWQYLKIE